MGYVGVPPQSGFITTAKQRVTGSTNNYVDLDNSISSLADVIVWVNFVKQSYTNLTLTTSTRITLGATLVASDIVEIAYLGKAVATQTPDTGTVTNDMLAGSIDLTSKVTGALPQANIADQAINEAKLQVSNAPTNGYMLTAQSGNTGGLTWAEAGGGGLTFIKREVLGSNGDFDIDNLFTTNFANYLVVLEDFTCTVDSQGLRMRMHDTSGIVTGAKYRYACRYFQDNGGLDSNTGVDQTYFQIATNSEEDATWIGYNAMLTFYKPRQNTSTRFTGNGSFIQNDKTNMAASYLAGHIDDEQEMRGLFFYYSSGGIRAGATITSYGFNES